MYEDRILTIAPLYRLRSGRAEIALGVTYVLDNDGFRNESALFPQVEFLCESGRRRFRALSGEWTGGTATTAIGRR